MHSQSNSWTALLAKLGINHKRNHSHLAKNNASSRKLRFENCEDRRMLAAFTVTNPGDAVENTPAAVGTLRQAIFDAEQTDDHDTIKFSPGLDGATILLDKTLLDNTLASATRLRITESVTIDATSLANGITIDAGGGADGVVGNGDGTSVFRIAANGIQTAFREFTLAGLTITGGDSQRKGGGVAFEASESAGNITLTIRDSVIRNNHTSTSGGGIGFVGTKLMGAITTPLTLNVIRSSIKDNTADGDAVVTIDGRDKGGGGIFVDAAGNFVDGGGVVFNLTDSTVSGNNSQHEGGGVWFCVAFGGTFNATQSTISNNQATVRGGGLWIANDPVDDTLFANLDHLTITDNASPDGGGLYSGDLFGNAHPDVVTTLNNTIVSDNENGSGSPNNIAGGIQAAASSYNLIGTSTAANPTGAGNLLNNNAPDLGPLMDNGGPTLTHKPASISLAVNTGDPSFSGTPAFDQRGPGFDRVSDSRIDIGAVEVQTPAVDLDAPQVFNITISGVQSTNGGPSTHAPYSFADQMNNDPNWISGHQLRTVPVGGADTVEIEFSEPIANLTPNSLFLKGLLTGYVPNLETYDYDPVSHIATWTFDAPFEGDQHYLSLSDTLVDEADNQLDGEWTNPFSVTTTNSAVSEFPSGDGNEGGDFKFVFTILPGDASLDNIANGIDLFLIYLPNLGNTGSTFEQADFNGDGHVDSAGAFEEDYALWLANHSQNLQELVFADFDASGVIDVEDYFIWLDNLGTGEEFYEGDANNDGDVDMEDFVLLQNQFELELDWVS